MKRAGTSQQWWRIVVARAYHLFVGDAGLAAATVVWLALGRWFAPYSSTLAGWRGPILFGGLAAILLWSALRCASRR